jgi:predicted DsbA family dithiol-disulfide isomerase
MQALLWRDYLCPWCYLGQDRTQIMRQLGVDVVPMSFELHPEVPDGGRPVRSGGRLDRVLDAIQLECDELAMPMRKPTRTPNTRRALEIAEILRTRYPGSFTSYDDSCYRSHWIYGEDLGDREVLRRLVTEAGADPDEVEELLSNGVGAAALAASMTTARDLGVAATPAWWVDERLLIPGAQPRASVERWVARLLEASAH